MWPVQPINGQAQSYINVGCRDARCGNFHIWSASPDDQVQPYLSAASSEVHALPHFLSSLEIGNVLPRNLNLFTRLRIAPNPWVPVIQAKAAKTAYLNATVGHQTVCNGLKNHVDHGLGVVVSKRWNAGMQPVNELGSGHEMGGSPAICLTAKPLAFAFFASVSSAVAIPLAPASSAIARCKA